MMMAQMMMIVQMIMMMITLLLLMMMMITWIIAVVWLMITLLGDSDDGVYAAGVIIMQPQWLITNESALLKRLECDREGDTL